MEKFSVFAWKKSELLVVGIIMALIFGISFGQLKVGEMKTRDAQRKADVELVARALQRYYEDYKVFPIATESGRILACGDKGAGPCNWGSKDKIVDYDNVEYLAGLPQDPFAHRGRNYVYAVDADRLHFKIYVALEYKRDSSWKKDLTVGCGDGVQCNWYVAN